VIPWRAAASRALNGVGLAIALLLGSSNLTHRPAGRYAERPARRIAGGGATGTQSRVCMALSTTDGAHGIGMSPPSCHLALSNVKRPSVNMPAVDTEPSSNKYF
jgi:hypothetical protein